MNVRMKIKKIFALSIMFGLALMQLTVFEATNSGRALCRGAAGEILAKRLLRLHGPTHSGQCPLGVHDGEDDD